MVSQVLGLDNYKHVSEFILGFLLSIGSTDLETNLVRCFNFDGFLAEAIHTQLVEFPKVSFFRYQSLIQKRGFFHGGFPRFILFDVKSCAK